MEVARPVYLTVPELSVFPLFSLRGFEQHMHSNGWCPGDPLEQCHWSGLAATGSGPGWGSVLGILLSEALLRCRVEPRWTLCVADLYSNEGLRH